MAEGGSPDFDVSTTGIALYSKLPLPDPFPNSGIQGHAFDDVHHRLYTVQCTNAMAGHLNLSWYDLTKGGAKQAQHMTLNNFGHGQQIGVQVVGSTTYIWTETDAILASNGIAYGSKICRFVWQPGVTLDGHTNTGMTKYALQPGSTGNSLALDIANNHLLLGFDSGSGSKAAVYHLDDIVNHGNAAVPIAAPYTSAWHTGTMQGRTLFGDYSYAITGAGKATLCGDAPEGWLGWQNIWDGTSGWVVNRTALTLPRRESEGLSIQTDGSVHRLVWSYVTKKDCTGQGNYLQSFYYIPDAPLKIVQPAQSGYTANPIGGPLGCGSYRVYAYDRGGQDRIGEITPIQSLSWNRVRDDISTALVSTVGFGADCCQMLEGLRSMRHELVIFRDGVRVWEGPITRIAYQADQVTIEARDVMQYVYRRIFRIGYDHRYKAGPKGSNGKPIYILYPHGNPVVSTVQFILNSVLKSSHIPVPDDPHELPEFTFGYDPNILKYLHIYPHTAAGDAHEARQVLPFSMTAWELIDDLAANSGIDYTVLGRSIMVWDTSYPIGKTEVLTDDAFMANPVVTEYGMSFATFSAVSDGSGFYGVSGASDAYYGMVEILSSSYGSSMAPDKTAYKAWTAVQQAHNKYIEAYHAYHNYPCLSSSEASRLARYYRERYTKGVKPARQKQLDALIKPLAARVTGCATLKTRMTKRYNEWKSANTSYNSYEAKINSYINSLNSQALRNLSGRRTVLTDQKTGATLKDKKGKAIPGGSPVVVRIPDNTQLSPNVMLGINDLVPGIWIPLRSTATCQTVQQWQKLDSVSVTYDTQTPEQVAVTMSLAPSGGQDFDSIPAPASDTGDDA